MYQPGRLGFQSGFQSAFQPARGNPAVSRSAYHAQAIEDQEHDAKRPIHPISRRPYKPTPLRLPFILVQIVFFCAAIGLVVYAIRAMPNSDSSARIGARAVPRSEPPPERPIPPQRRRLESKSTLPSSSLTVVPSAVPSDAPSAVPSAVLIRRAATSASQSVRTTLITLTTSTPTVLPGTTRVVTSTIISTGVNTSVTTFESTLSQSFFTTSFLTTSRVTRTRTGGINNGTTLPSTEIETDTTLTITSTDTFGGGVTQTTATSFITYSSAFTTVQSEILPPKTYLTLGEVIITSVYTVELPSQIAPPATTIIESVVDGRTETILQVQDPVTQTIEDPRTSVLVWTPPAETIVRTSGGGSDLLVVVTQPTAESQVGVETTINGQVTTIFGGTLSFRPITLTVASSSVETIATLIDGTSTTITSTRLFSSVTVVTPSGSGPLSFTVISTQSGSLVTLISTLAPTSVSTTISGSRTTTLAPSTRTLVSTGSSSTSTLTSISTPTSSGPSSVVVFTTKTYQLNEGQYFLGLFLPILIALGLAGFLRVIDNNVKLFQPFHALTRPDGAVGAESLTLQYTGLLGWVRPLTNLAHGYPVPFVSQTILLLSSLMVPLAAEALGVKLHGSCGAGSVEGRCAGALGVSPGPAYALIAVMSLIVVLLVVLLILLRRFSMGLCANPWSVAGIASLGANPDVRVLQGDEASMKRAFESSGRRYKFGYYENHDLLDEYGIVLLDESGQGLHQNDNLNPGASSVDDVSLVGAAQAPSADAGNPFLALTTWWRVLFVLFLCGLFAMILYHHLSVGQSSDFSRFMDSHTFGVRFLFALLGVAVTFCWTCFFTSLACVAPFRAMMRHSQPPERSILVTHCSNGFYGLYRGASQREPYTFVVALMACLSEFLPIVLSNVPYAPTQTLTTHIVCARISIVILGAMIVTMLCSWFLVFPLLPADPRSIAGLLYYVSDSYFLRTLEGVSLLNGRERRRRIQELGRRFYYADDFIGRSGCRRNGGIDSDAALADNLDQTITAYSGYQTEYQAEPQAAYQHGGGGGGGYHDGGGPQAATGHPGAVPQGTGYQVACQGGYQGGVYPAVYSGS